MEMKQDPVKIQFSIILDWLFACGLNTVPEPRNIEFLLGETYF